MMQILHENGKKLTPTKSIREYCLDCSNGSSHEVKFCPAKECPLYPYRFGKNPNIKLSEETKRKRAQQLKKNRLNAETAQGNTTQKGD